MSYNVELTSAWQRGLFRAVKPQMDRWAASALADMRRLVPVDTGHLRSTLHAEYDPDTGVMTVGADADYATPVELGHVTSSGSFVPPQPFIRPAIDARRDLL